MLGGHEEVYSHEQCGLANSAPRQEVTASLLQTQSKRSSQPYTVQELVASKPQISKQPGRAAAPLSVAGDIQTEKEKGAQTSLAANLLGGTNARSAVREPVALNSQISKQPGRVLAVAGDIQNENATRTSLAANLLAEKRRTATFYLGVLAIVVVGCILCGVTHVGKENNEGRTSQGHGLGGVASPSSKDLLRSPSTQNTLRGNGSRATLTPPRSPRLPGHSPRQAETSPTDGAGRHLCPGLVVPYGNESILAVPVLPTSGAHAPAHAHAHVHVAKLLVQDLDGKAVIQAEVTMPPVLRADGGGPPLILLRAASGQTSQPLLAYCKAVAGNSKCVSIYDARDDLYGQITKDPANPYRYTLTSRHNSLKLGFSGDFKNHAVTATNEQNVCVAETHLDFTSRLASWRAVNPAGVHYKLRVVSNTDVGLMLCALLAIDCLELSPP